MANTLFCLSFIFGIGKTGESNIFMNPILGLKTTAVKAQFS